MMIILLIVYGVIMFACLCSENEDANTTGGLMIFMLLIAILAKWVLA